MTRCPHCDRACTKIYTHIATTHAPGEPTTNRYEREMAEVGLR